MSIVSERKGEMELNEKRQTVGTLSVLKLFVTIYYFNIFILDLMFSFVFYIAICIFVCCFYSVLGLTLARIKEQTNKQKIKGKYIIK